MEAKLRVHDVMTEDIREMLTYSGRRVETVIESLGADNRDDDKII